MERKAGKAGVCTCVGVGIFVLHCGSVWMPVGACDCISVCQRECLCHSP